MKTSPVISVPVTGMTENWLRLIKRDRRLNLSRLNYTLQGPLRLAASSRSSCICNGPRWRLISRLFNAAR